MNRYFAKINGKIFTETDKISGNEETVIVHATGFEAAEDRSVEKYNLNRDELEVIIWMGQC